MFFTFKLKKSETQISFDTLLNNYDYFRNNPVNISPRSEKFYNTYTVDLKNYDKNHLIQKYNVIDMANKINTMGLMAKDLLQENMLNQYTTFHIPKTTGGMRRIDAPEEPLMSTLRTFKETFERQLKVLSHDAAYAYVSGRSTKDALVIHQKNQSKWFLKLDIKNFFPNCTFELIMKQLEKLFPFKLLMEHSTVKESLENIIKLCLLNNTLPQGTPMSPLLTNLIMIPYDYTLQRTLWDFDRQTFKYTRYADDLLISCRYDFNFENVQHKIAEILQPFTIKTEKTRYGSLAGRNWNLGLMLNKDNQITIGSKRKKRFKAAIFSFLTDLTNGETWDILDVQALLGQYSYYRKIEPDYIDHVIRKYTEQFDLNPRIELIKRIKEQ